MLKCWSGPFDWPRVIHFRGSAHVAGAAKKPRNSKPPPRWYDIEHPFESPCLQFRYFQSHPIVTNINSGAIAANPQSYNIDICSLIAPRDLRICPGLAMWDRESLPPWLSSKLLSGRKSAPMTGRTRFPPPSCESHLQRCGIWQYLAE